MTVEVVSREGGEVATGEVAAAAAAGLKRDLISASVGMRIGTAPIGMMLFGLVPFGMLLC